MRGARHEVGKLRGTLRGISARNGVISETPSVRGRAIVLYLGLCAAVCLWRCI